MAEGTNRSNTPGGDIGDEKYGTGKSLESMPIQELRKRAENRGIKDTRDMNKQQIIEMLHKKGE